MDIKLQEGEKIIKKGGANLSTILQGKGGHLYLTNQRLVFIGHGMNIGKDKFEIDLSDVQYVEKAPTVSLWLLFIPIPNAIKVGTNNGRITKFTVTNRKDWIEKINNTIKA